MSDNGRAGVRDVALPQGTVRCVDTGEGPPILLVHGVLVSGSLWRDVVPILARDFRVIAPDLPLGCHPVPMKADADLSPPGVARLIADLMEELDLRDVTLVGNDTGGALCQLVATRHGERVGRIVLTPCDAYEQFPPPAFKPLLGAARLPGMLTAIMAPLLAVPPVRKTPLAFGLLMKRPRADLMDAWVKAYFADRGVRRDTRKVIKGIHPQLTIDAAEKLKTAGIPLLLAWAPEDRAFRISLAERLAADVPGARIERIDDAYTFVSLDQPERTAEAIASFVREAQPASSG